MKRTQQPCQQNKMSGVAQDDEHEHSPVGGLHKHRNATQRTSTAGKAKRASKDHDGQYPYHIHHGVYRINDNKLNQSPHRVINTRKISFQQTYFYISLG
jgi:hypothetical protein